MTLQTAAEVNAAMDFPDTSRPVLTNGWVAAEPVAVWQAGANVRIVGAVRDGLPATAAFALNPDQSPAARVVGDRVTVEPDGEVLVDGEGQVALDVEVTPATGEPGDRASSPTS